MRCCKYLVKSSFKTRYGDKAKNLTATMLCSHCCKPQPKPGGGAFCLYRKQRPLNRVGSLEILLSRSLMISVKPSTDLMLCKPAFDYIPCVFSFLEKNVHLYLLFHPCLLYRLCTFAIFEETSLGEVSIRISHRTSCCYCRKEGPSDSSTLQSPPASKTCHCMSDTRPVVPDTIHGKTSQGSANEVGEQGVSGHDDPPDDAIPQTAHHDNTDCNNDQSAAIPCDSASAKLNKVPLEQKDKVKSEMSSQDERSHSLENGAGKDTSYKLPSTSQSSTDKVNAWVADVTTCDTSSASDLPGNDVDEDAEPYTEDDRRSVSSSESFSTSSSTAASYTNFLQRHERCSPVECHKMFWDAVIYHAQDDLDTGSRKLMEIQNLIGKHKARKVVLWHDIQSSTFCRDLEIMIASAYLIVILVTKSLETDQKAIQGVQMIYMSLGNRKTRVLCVQQGYGKGEKPSGAMWNNMPDCIDIDDDAHFKRSIEQRLRKARKKRSVYDEYRKKCEEKNGNSSAQEREPKVSTQHRQYPKDTRVVQSSANDSGATCRTQPDNVNFNKHSNPDGKEESAPVPLTSGNETNHHLPESASVCISGSERENACHMTQLTVENSSKSSSSASSQTDSRGGRGGADKGPDNVRKADTGNKKKQHGSRRDVSSELARGQLSSPISDLPSGDLVSDGGSSNTRIQFPAVALYPDPVLRREGTVSLALSEMATGMEREQLQFSPSDSSQWSQPSHASILGLISSTDAATGDRTGDALQDEDRPLATHQSFQSFYEVGRVDLQTYSVPTLNSPDKTILSLTPSSGHRKYLSEVLFDWETQQKPVPSSCNSDSDLHKSKFSERTINCSVSSVTTFASQKVDVGFQNRSEQSSSADSILPASFTGNLGSVQKESGTSEDAEQNDFFNSFDQKTLDTDLNACGDNKRNHTDA